MRVKSDPFLVIRCGRAKGPLNDPARIIRMKLFIKQHDSRRGKGELGCAQVHQGNAEMFPDSVFADGPVPVKVERIHLVPEIQPGIVKVIEPVLKPALVFFQFGKPILPLVL